MNTIVSRTLSVHKEHELLLKLEAVGLNDKLAQRVIDSKRNNLAANVVRLIEISSFEQSTSQKYAREIMGKNFFGIEEAIKHFGVSPTKQQLAHLAEVPFTKEALQSCKDTHVLVAVFPLSILDIRDIVERFTDQTLFFYHQWYDKQAFAKDKGEVAWQLVRKGPVADSSSKTWVEQQALLSEDEETPSAQIVVYTIMGHFLATGERLLNKGFVRCQDLDWDGQRVLLGSFNSSGLSIYKWYDNKCLGGLHLSAAKKST